MAAEQLTHSALARLVGTSRQNIENLLTKGVRTPSYLPELAQVMGTTVDELLGQGRRRGKDSTDARLESALQLVAATINQFSGQRLALARAALHGLIEAPNTYSSVARTLKRLTHR